MEGTLTIDRVYAEYLVDRNVPNLGAIRDRCDEAMGARLESALAATLARWCDRDDASIWVVRCVDIAIAANAILPSEALSRDVARAVAINLRDILIGHGDGVEAIRFADAAALLARFLVDSAHGDAASRWYYGRYRGLRLLPTTAALRTAICEDPQRGLTALQRLSDDELAGVSAALSAADCRFVRINLARATDETDASRCLDACRDAWANAARHRLGAASQELLLFVRAVGPTAGGSELNRIIDALGQLANVLQKNGGWADWLQRGGANRSAIAHLNGAAQKELIDTLKPPSSRTDVNGVDEASYASDFGGCFLLLPLWVEVERELVAAADFPAEGSEALACLRLLVISSCMGADNAETAYQDPVPRFACGVEFSTAFQQRSVALASMAELSESLRQRMSRALTNLSALPPRSRSIPRAEQGYFKSVTRRHPLEGWSRLVNALAYEVLKRFAQRLPGFADSGCAYLWKNFLNRRSQIDFEENRIVVRLARAPLDLVLSLSGMNKASYVLPFGDTRPYTLFTGD